MISTTEWSAGPVGDPVELYRRMWVLRLLDMGLEELRVQGLLEEPLRAGFGQEAVAVGATAALRTDDFLESKSEPSADPLVVARQRLIDDGATDRFLDELEQQARCEMAEIQRL